MLILFDGHRPLYFLCN